MLKRAWAVLLLSFAIPVMFFAGCAEEKECMSHYDCPSGQICVDYQCVEPPSGGVQGQTPGGPGDYDMPPGIDVEPSGEIPDCDDGNVCTYDYFDGNRCVHEPLGPEIACVTPEGRPGHCPPVSQCTEESCECVPDRINCDDGLDCTHDYADVQGACHHDIIAGTCLIDNQCYNNGDPNPGNVCLVCDSETSQTEWTPAPEGTACDDGDPNTINDACNGEGVCVGEQVPECTEDSDCDDSLDCTIDTCSNGTCQHELQDGYCLIDNTCYAAGDPNPAEQCRVCNPDESTEDWSLAPVGTSCDDGDPNTVGDACTETGECVGQTPECSVDTDCDDRLICTTDACVNGVCENTLQDGWCLIDGACYADGEKDPANQCMACHVDTDAHAWTPEPAGTACDDGDLNTINDACDGAGTCVGETAECNTNEDCTPTHECLVGECVNNTCEFSVAEFKCFIDGVCYDENDVNPDNSCQGCIPSQSQTEWSNADGLPCDDGNVCTNNDVCVNGQCSGEWIAGCCLSNADCDDGLDCTEDSCDDNTNTCVNTVVEGYCVIDEQCVEDGTENPDNYCQACDASTNQYGWSPAHEGEQCDPNDESKVCISGECLVPWQCTDDSYEDNDNFMEATSIEINQVYDNLQACQNDVGGDWYKVSLPDCASTITVNVNFTHSEGDINVIVYSYDGSQLVEVGSGMSMDDNETVELTNVTAGDYYIYVSLYVVSGQDIDGNSYSLEVVVPEECLVECTEDADCNDEIDCTVDTCVEGKCSNAIVSGWCLIDGVCYEDDTTNPENFCLACIVDVSQTEWSYANEMQSCGDGKVCHLGECVDDTGQCMPDQFEPNDTFEEATLIEVNHRYTGLTACSDDVNDYFKVMLYACDEPVEIYISFSHSEGDIDLYLYDADQNWIDSSMSSDDDEQISYTVTETGMYYIRTRQWTSGARNGYVLDVYEPERCIPQPCSTDEDCDDGLACTQDMCVGGTCQHPVMDDWCLIDGVCYTSGTENPENYCQACDPTQDQSDWSDAHEGESCGEGRRCEGGECVEYCVEDEYEENDDADTATTIEVGTEYQAHVCSGDEDWYKFEVTDVCANQPVRVFVGFTHAEGDIDIYVYKEGDYDNYIVSGYSSDDNEEVTFVPDTGGVYYLKVKLYSDNGTVLGNDYSVLVETCLPLPVQVYDIQNPDSTNHPAEDTKVKVEGAIVTTNVFTISSRYNLDGFFISDPEGGAWHGILVAFYTTDMSVNVQLGDEVTVVGTYKEYYGLSEIMLESYTVTGTGTVPAPTVIDDPCSIATNGDLAEQYEGVLVQVNNVTVTQEANQYDEFIVNDCLMVDDLIYDYTNPPLNTQYSTLVGILYYSYSNFKLEPRDANDMIEAGSGGGAELGGVIYMLDGWKGVIAAGVPDVNVELLDFQSGDPIAFTTSDDQGIYNFSDINPGIYVVRLTADFIADTSFAIMVPDGATSMSFDWKVVRRGTPEQFDATAEYSYTSMSGLTITIPANSVVDGSGTQVNSAQIYVTELDVSDPLQRSAAPGNFWGVDSNGENVPLESGGMVEIVLRNADGDPLNLDDGTHATIQFPLPQHIAERVNDNDTIPMWWFDTTTGMWREEGTATVQTIQGGMRVATGTVSHFTWWNLDFPQSELDCVFGLVSRADGSRVPNAEIEFYSDNYYLTYGTYTATGEGAGSFCAVYIKGATITVKAKALTASGNGPLIAYLTGVQLLDNGVGFEGCGGDVSQCKEVSITLPAETCVSGTVLDANGVAVANAQVIGVARMGDYFRAEELLRWTATTDSDGTFCLPVMAGMPDLYEGSMVSYDLDLRVLAPSGWAHTMVNVGTTAAACGSSNCVNAGTLTLMPYSSGGEGCLTGYTVSASGVPAMKATPEGEPIPFIDVFVFGSEAHSALLEAGYDVCAGTISPDEIGSFFGYARSDVYGYFEVYGLPTNEEVVILACFTGECGPSISDAILTNGGGDSSCADAGEIPECYYSGGW